MHDKATINSLHYTGFEFKKESGDVRKLQADSMAVLIYTYLNERKTLILDPLKTYRSDGASMPRGTTWILPAWNDKPGQGIKNMPAIIHDILCTFGGSSLPKTIVSFEEASAIFEALLIYCGACGRIRARICWAGVASTVGNYYFYNSDSNDKYNYSRVSWTWSTPKTT